MDINNGLVKAGAAVIAKRKALDHFCALRRYMLSFYFLLFSILPLPFHPPIQAEAIPLLLEGRGIVGYAQAGTG
jgi:hypothetical protein